MADPNPLPNQLNIAPRGKSWLGGKLVEGDHGYSTREDMEHAERVSPALDRLDRFRASIKWKLERDIEHVGHQTKFAKMWPDRADGIRQELQELDKLIADNRDILASLDDFEREEREFPRSATHTVTLSQNQLYELSDAANEVMTRMLRDGQNETEIKLRALSELFGAFKVLQLAMLGTLDTPGMNNLEPQVLKAIAHPKITRD